MVDIHRRSPLEESTGRTTGDQTLLEGEADRITRKERRQRENEKEETGELRGQGTRENLGGGGEGERKGQEQSSDGKK